MITITCTSPVLETALPQDDEWLPEFGQLLIALAQKHLAKTSSDEWLSFGQVMKLCRNYRHALKLNRYDLSDTQSQLIKLFGGKNTIQQQGIRIHYRTTSVPVSCRPTPMTVHQLKFQQL